MAHPLDHDVGARRKAAPYFHRVGDRCAAVEVAAEMALDFSLGRIRNRVGGEILAEVRYRLREQFADYVVEVADPSSRSVH